MKRTEFKIAFQKALANSDCLQQVDHELVNRIIRIICMEIQNGVSEGRIVSIRGFGSFRPKYYLGNESSSVFESGSDMVRTKSKYYAKPSFKAGIVLTNSIIKS